jgi:hypothetical protein
LRPASNRATERPEAAACHGRSRWRGLRIGLALGLACLAILAGPVAAASDADDVKLAFLYNFTKFLEWPKESFDTDRSPIVIGVAGDEALATSFSALLANKPAGSRAVIVRNVAESGSLPDCHVLFLRSSSRRRVTDVADELEGKAVLLVGEDEHFLVRGGMVNFVLRSERIRFEINLVAAQKAGLKLSSKLVSVASAVYEPGRGGR